MIVKIKKVQNGDLTPKRGFSMIELIFVIVILGIMASVGGSIFPDHRFMNDRNFITMNIKETQKNAIGKNIHDFNDAPWSRENNATCITLTKNGFLEKEGNVQKPHQFAPNLKLSVDGNKTLCFDEYGRPYQDGNLIHSSKDINATYKGRSKIISVLPMSGYVIIK